MNFSLFTLVARTGKSAWIFILQLLTLAHILPPKKTTQSPHESTFQMKFSHDAIVEENADIEQIKTKYRNPHVLHNAILKIYTECDNDYNQKIDNDIAALYNDANGADISEITIPMYARKIQKHHVENQIFNILFDKDEEDSIFKNGLNNLNVKDEKCSVLIEPQANITMELYNTIKSNIINTITVFEPNLAQIIELRKNKGTNSKVN